ncbi:two-component sensor histidine kinase [Pseudoxanthomonas broegbernensis]|uniref:histidine kinase n=1 Tax=Pseudoxanthomonas broegbernensis TaxID=83619 RepID=A0A7V8GKJ9_9GAMM|nr:HAMP domain-containing sensor histidine kinase [Pseudoxanthomonas broegbernensis]KAF1685029.1 two-component sensor histidine kinase [Pseudoxanthomonas broegbernensis]MBB6066369.1 signal transduction histidine kinase [Pseudoxanthomonas broegbernensis]
MPHGLPRKIRIAFILQMVMASLAIVVAFYVVAILFKYSFIQNTLQEEAQHYWQLYDASPAQPPPNTYNLRGYLVEAGYSSLSLPPDLRELRPGFHDLEQQGQLVWVDRRQAGTLYLVFLRSQATRMALWFAVLPAMLTLLAIYGATWLTYRSSQRLVSPVAWLARQVGRWDPRRPDVTELAPELLPADVQGEARQLAQALHGLGERVQAHIARERNFTRHASHELRTPLTVIRMASDVMLAGDELPPRVARGLQRIQRAGRDMEAVVDAFLILAREPDVAPQSEWFQVCEVVHQEADNARLLLGDKPVVVEVDCLQQPMLYAPPRVLHVVLGNLLRNACHYTDRGRVRVTVDETQVVVSDTGIGMTPEILASAFEPFFRGVPERPHGTGLGLAIVRRLCERFGWRVELESVQDAGTTASIHFAPVRGDTQQVPGAVPPA